MLRFHNGGTKTIWSTKGTNEFHIVNKQVLPWKIEAISANTIDTKDFAMAVKPLKSIIQHCESVRIMYVMLAYVAKF